MNFSELKLSVLYGIKCLPLHPWYGVMTQATQASCTSLPLLNCFHALRNQKSFEVAMSKTLGPRDEESSEI